MWTEQTVETLKKFAFEGRSAAWIAAALGAPSRNAVIGKANRIGIKLNGIGVPSGRGAPEPPPQIPWGQKRTPSIEGEQRRERASPAVIPWGRPAPRAQRRDAILPPETMRARRWTYAEAEVGEMRRVGFSDIGEVECRWPIGDPTQEDFAYCGLPIARGRAYCAGHCRLAYRPPSP